MPEVNNDQQFAELAHSALQSKAPNIMPFVSGFQTLTSSDDNTRMVGMFGVSVGANLFFIPVFFLKGVVKPLELIFDYKGDRFLPFTRDGVATIMKSDHAALGASARDPRAGFSDLQSPNVDAASAGFTSSNSFSKVASELPGLGYFTREVSSLRPGSYLPSFLEKSAMQVKKAMISLMQDEEVARAVHKKIGLDLIKKAFASNSREIVDGVQQEDTPATEAGGVEIISVNPRANAKAILDKVPQEKLSKAMKKGYYICDHRKATSMVYNSQYANSFTNPHQSGEFTTIAEDGTLQRVLVLYHPHALEDNQSMDRCVLVDPLVLSYGTFEPREVDISPVRRSEEVAAKVLSRGISAKHMQPGRKYLIVTPDLKSWASAQIETTRYTATGTTHYKATAVGTWDSVYMVAGLANAEKFKKVGSEVIIPGKAVAIDVTDCAELRVGRLGDLSNHLIHTGLEPTIITHDGVEFNVGGGQKVDRQAAVRKLVMEQQLSESDTEELLDKAASQGRVTYLVKKANPTFMNDLEGSDRPDSTIAAPSSVEQVPQYNVERAVSFEDPYLAMGMPETPMLPSLMLTAASMGGPDIFDGSVLASLAEREDIYQAALEFTPDLERAVDKLGRLLFLLWWQYDKFRDKYSPAELTTLEADLKQLIYKLGGLAYKLKNRVREFHG